MRVTSLSTSLARIVASCTVAMALLNVAYAAKSTTIQLNANGQRISFLNPADGSGGFVTLGPNATAGFSYRYSDVIVIGGQRVDALVTIASTLNIYTIYNLDGAWNSTTSESTYPIDFEQWVSGDGYSCVGSPKVCYPAPPSNGYTTLRVEFFLHNSTTRVELQNFNFWVDDIDMQQFVEATGADSVTVTNDSAVKVLYLGSNTFRAFEPSYVRFNYCRNLIWVRGCEMTNLQRARAQFNYSSASTVNIKLGQQREGMLSIS